MLRITQKITLRRVRRSIVCSSNLLRDTKPIPLSSRNVESINCYAYSLGIMYNKSKKVNHVPGYTAGKYYEGISPLELVRNITIDLNNLQIPFRRIELDEDTELHENEYLVKVFYAPRSINLARGDFHFIRRDNVTGLWFHKMGWYKQPCLTQLDYDFKKEFLGCEPERITSREDDGSFIFYQPVCYFAITEVQKKFLPARL